MTKIKHFAPTLFVVLLLLVTMGFIALDQTERVEGAKNTVVLPIEVWGRNGAQPNTVSVTVHASNVSGVNRLYLQLHQPSYHPNTGYLGRAKISVRVNGGTWTDLTNKVFDCYAPEKYDDCISELTHTVRGTMPVSGLRNGANEISFRFNGTDGIGSGFRVLDIKLLMRGGADAIDGTTFVRDDPSTWRAPAGYDAPSDVDAGRALFNSRNTLVDTAPNGNGGYTNNRLVAACVDCHAKDAHDLQYFAYSNASIIARAQYHGLSEEQGKKIAAYVRAHRLEHADGSTYDPPGRPWNPPYQPGPTLAANGGHPDKAKPAFWASGAGWDWVLEDDEDMLPYLFPDPSEVPGRDGKRYNHQISWRAADIEGTHNMRETPLSVAMPDWNNWLPDIHPIDVLEESTFLNTEANREYDALVAERERTNRGSTNLEGVEKKIGHFQAALLPLRNTIDWAGGLNDQELGLAMLSLRQWGLLKVWETMHLYHLEDKTDDVYANTPRRDRKPEHDWRFDEPLGWMATQRIAFNLGPHISQSKSRKGDQIHGYETGRAWTYYTHIWYHLQLILNPGTDPQSSQQNPVDWNYQKMFLRGAAGRAPLPMRQAQTWIKMTQMLKGSIEAPIGLAHQAASPRILAWWAQGGGQTFNTLDDYTRKEVVTALLRAWVKYRFDNFTVNEEPTGPDNKTWDPHSTRPTLGNFDVSNRVTFQSASALYRSVKIFDNLGVPASLLDSLADFGQAMWPNPDGPAWHDLISNRPNNSAPQVRAVKPGDGASFLAPADVAFEVEASDEDGKIARVEFYANGTKLGEQTNAPYRFTWNGVGAGGYSLVAKAVDNEGAASTSRAVSIVVNVASRSTAQTIHLQQGWNFVSRNVEVPDPSFDVLLDDVIDRVAVVKNEEGKIFAPQQNVDQLGTWDLQEAYMIFANEEVEFSIEGSPVDPTATPIPLEAGWNLVPYLGEEPVALEEAVTSVADKLIMVKDQEGNVYFPEHGVNAIGELEPGQGYKFHMEQPATLLAPGSGGTALYRINAGGAQYTDPDGNTWEADAYSTGGRTYGANGAPAIDGTGADALYQTEHYGKDFAYAFSVSNGTYDVALHFAEIFQGVDASGNCPVGGDCTGQRVFDVKVEGQTVLDNYDIYAAAGASARSIVEVIPAIEVVDGTLDITFTTNSEGTDNAKISAIAVFPAGHSESSMFSSSLRPMERNGNGSAGNGL